MGKEVCSNIEANDLTLHTPLTSGSDIEIVQTSLLAQLSRSDKVSFCDQSLSVNN